MNYVSTKVAPSNSIIFVADIGGGKTPDTIPSVLITSTPSCVAIGCKMELDGDTTITLGACREVELGGTAAYECTLETPNRKVAVFTVPDVKILELHVSNPKTLVRIWVNDGWEPDEIVIGLE